MTALNERAMLASLNISHWTARKHDRDVSEEVAKQHDADAAEAGRYNKILIAPRALKKTASVAAAARDHHYTNTLPWTDKGARILPAANYWQYVEKQRAYRADFERAVEEFVKDYSAHVAEAKHRLNGLFKDEDYPTVAQLRRRFAFTLDFMPLPDAADFRVSLADGEEARIRKDIESRMKDATERAVQDLWLRIHDAVSHMHERLTAYAVDRKTGKVTGGVFRDTLVTNLQELVELLPRLNVTGDAQLEAMRQQLAEKLCQHEPQTLREDESAREETAQSAAAILEAMAGYIGDTQ